MGQNMVCVRYAHARPRVGDRVHCPEACDNASGSAVRTAQPLWVARSRETDERVREARENDVFSRDASVGKVVTVSEL